VGTLVGVNDPNFPVSAAIADVAPSDARRVRGRAVLIVGLGVLVLLAAWWMSGDSERDATARDNGEVACVGEEDEGTSYRSGYRVTDGQLGARCFGTEDQRLVDAFAVLSAITPGGQLHDLSSFTGFTQDRGGDLLAYVTIADETGSTFEMAINLDETGDTDELNLTMIHELTHVFAATPNELDRSVDADECNTYWNGEGCYLEASVLAAWVDTFWRDEIDEFDPLAPEYDNGGEQRCSLNPGFFGPYSATSPEEDFAEAFSAFVFGVDARTDGQQQRLDWIAAQPGLDEFRTRAVAAGFAKQPHTFAACG